MRINKNPKRSKLRSIELSSSNKRGFEFSFSWIFAFIAGAMIIFLAVYAANRLVSTNDFVEQAKRGKEIGILLNPIETNLEGAKYTRIIVPEETTIFNGCENSGIFGKQKISVALKSSINEEEKESAGVESSFKNKYLFSRKSIKSKKEFYVLSKPFKFPFKIGDIMIMWSDKEEYCFVNAPEDIKKELNDSLKLDMVSFSRTSEKCASGSKKVCFPPRGENCDIEVSFNSKSISFNEDKKTVYFTYFDDSDKYSLLYAGIFSDPEVYECQIKRLMGRASELSSLYEDKSVYLQQQKCGSANLIGDLESYRAESKSMVNDDSSLRIKDDNFNSLVIQLEEKNAKLICKLF
ncbi:MAG: hypothetical protein AABY05_02365 [Nanoarchaeota archaeon]